MMLNSVGLPAHPKGCFPIVQSAMGDHNWQKVTFCEQLKGRK